MDQGAVGHSERQDEKETYLEIGVRHGQDVALEGKGQTVAFEGQEGRFEHLSILWEKVSYWLDVRTGVQRSKQCYSSSGA